MLGAGARGRPAARPDRGDAAARLGRRAGPAARGRRGVRPRRAGAGGGARRARRPPRPAGAGRALPRAERDAPATSSTGSRPRRWRCSTRSPRAAGTPARRPRSARRCSAAPTPASSACCASPRPRSCRGSGARPTSSTTSSPRCNGRHVPAGPSGAPTRGRLDVLPTGRNFYSVDPRALPSELSYEVGCKLADALLERHAHDTGELPQMVGLVAWGTAAMRTQGDDVAEILALLGVRPTWHPRVAPGHGHRGRAAARSSAGRGSTSPCASRASSATRSRTSSRCSTTRSARVAALDEPDDRTSSPRTRAPTPSGSRRELGAEPGLAPRDDAHLRLEARHVRRRACCSCSTRATGATTPTSPRSTRRGAATRTAAASTAPPRAEPMRDCYARIDVAVKNVDSREHDILDSDDYYQFHGGMIATVRALTGTRPGGVPRRQLATPRASSRGRSPRRRGGCSAPASPTRAGSRR